MSHWACSRHPRHKLPLKFLPGACHRSPLPRALGFCPSSRGLWRPRAGPALPPEAAAPQGSPGHEAKGRRHGGKWGVGAQGRGQESSLCPDLGVHPGHATVLA